MKECENSVEKKNEKKLWMKSEKVESKREMGKCEDKR